jgi:hypothetical protein
VVAGTEGGQGVYQGGNKQEVLHAQEHSQSDGKGPLRLSYG